jgi:lipoprotein-anchoring transpeptidase ErfK/SrfK
MLRWRLDPERHGSAGFTTIPRVVAVAATVGFLALATKMTLTAWYDGRIMPGVVAAGHNLGGLTLAQARSVLQQEAKSYQLNLVVAGQKYQLSAAQLGVAFDAEATLGVAYRTGRNTWYPPLHTEPVPMAYHLDRPTLKNFATSVSAQVGVQPVDAAVVFANGKFETVPDKTGVTVDRRGLERLIEQDLRFPTKDGLQLKPRAQTADIRVGALGPTIAEARQLIATPVVLTYGERTFTPTQSQIGQWLAFEKRLGEEAATLEPKVDSSRLKDYVQNLANQLDVAPVNKRVNIENNVSKVVTEGVDGLAIDQDKLVAAITAAVTNRRPLTFTITSHVVPFKTVSTTFVTLDYPKYIEVNIAKQRMWLWQDKQMILESPITSGATGAGFGTVTGLFSIYYKTTNTRLRGYQYGWNYDVPVKYWMPFHGGYGLHDAEWRHGKFGGQDYYYGGSHGCVNMPDATAEFVYNWAEIGTPVWVHK